MRVSKNACVIAETANPATGGEAGVDLGGAAEVVQGLARP